MPKTLNIDKLTCGYGSKFNITDISFSVPQGSFMGIIGPNGSGKTTLFRGITGSLKTKRGSISINNKNLTDYNYKEKARHLAIVTQNIEAAQMTVEEYVLMGRMPYQAYFTFFESKKDYEIARKYMKLTNTYRFKDKYMHNLSGGEQQLAGIARALAQEPELLLLDEPTSHLDITHQVQILNLLQKLNTDLKLSVLMIIHDLNLAGEYCDYLVMMNKGKVHTQGSPEAVLNYQNIEEVYETIVVTEKNPLSGKPVIFLVSDKVLKSV